MSGHQRDNCLRDRFSDRALGHFQSTKREQRCCRRGGIVRAIEVKGSHRPTIASTSAFKKRSTTNMKPIEGTSNNNAVIDAIW